eukprot:ANDGO_03001.mRNA.1 hypothetical protein
MASRKRYLADVISDYLDPTPKDFDPVDELDASVNFQSSEAHDGGNDDAGSAGRVLKKKKLGLKASIVDDQNAKYAGKKTSRKEIFEQSTSIHQDDHHQRFGTDDGSRDDDDDDDDGGESEIEDDMSIGDMSDDEDDAMKTRILQMFGSSNQKHSDENDGRNGNKGEREDENQEGGGEGEITVLSAHREKEVEKGKAVERQTQYVAALTATRIRLQRPLSILQQVSSSLSSSLSSSRSRVLRRQSIAKQLRSLLVQLLQLSNAHVGVQIDGSSESLEELYKVIAAREEEQEGWRWDVAEKWNTRVGLAAGGVSNATFRAIHQSVKGQVENELRMMNVLKKQATEVEGKDGDYYDDGEFYAVLLKTVLGDAESARRVKDDGLTKKSKKIVDRRASKGRKIRFHTIEKLVSFMVPRAEPAVQEQALYIAEHLFGK